MQSWTIHGYFAYMYKCLFFFYVYIQKFIYNNMFSLFYSISVLYIYMCVCVWEKLEMNWKVWKCTEMKKTQGLQRVILFIELFTNVKRFVFF